MLLSVVRPLPLLPFLVCCRGILLYGPPGTGKTLLARAVAGECARISPQPVTLFARKGADCLGKYAGDAERTLRLIFEEVSRQPHGRAITHMAAEVYCHHVNHVIHSVPSAFRKQPP